MDKKSTGIGGTVTGRGEAAPPGTVEVCARTNLTKPECSCRLCCQSLLAQYAPQLDSNAAMPLGPLSNWRADPLPDPVQSPERAAAAQAASRTKVEAALRREGMPEQQMAMQGLRRRIAELEAEVRRLGELAHTDALTGLPNRRALEAALARELARSARAGQPLCLAVLDLDHFKAVNDVHGHPRGDQLLCEAAVAWRAELRADDLLARNYGDEFATVLPNCPPEEATEVIERLRAATPAGQTCSAGLVRWDGRESTEAIGARADRALYAAKQAGRNLTIAAGHGISAVERRRWRGKLAAVSS